MLTAVAVLCGLAWGALTAFVNFLIMKKSLAKQNTKAVIGSSYLRTLIDVASLAAILLARNILPFDYTVTLIAAAAVMGILTVVFTYRLTR